MSCGENYNLKAAGVFNLFCLLDYDNDFVAKYAYDTGIKLMSFYYLASSERYVLEEFKEDYTLFNCCIESYMMLVLTSFSVLDFGRIEVFSYTFFRPEYYVSKLENDVFDLLVSELLLKYPKCNDTNGTISCDCMNGL